MTNLFPKKYDNSFKTFLREDTVTSILSSGNAEMGLDSEEQIRTLEAVNSVLAGLTDTPALNPYYMLQRIKDRVKLATGLTFDDLYFTGTVGVYEKPLYPVDNINGKTHTGFMVRPVVDNGFLNKFPGGLVIRFQSMKAGTLFHIVAEIKKAPESPQMAPAKIHEKKDK